MTDDSFPRTSGSSGSPWMLLVPVLFGVLAALWWSDWFGDEGPTLAPRVEPPAEIGAFVAVEGDGLAPTGWSRIQLAPLRADPVRQAFESEAIRRRRDWERGELWRLTLQRGAEAASISMDAGQLARLRVEDPEGLALSSIDQVSAAAGQPAGDPLDVLLAGAFAGVDRLEAGSEVQLLLWGRRPAEGARLLGLPGREAGAGSSVDLASIDLPRDDFPRYLARLAPATPEAGDEAPDGAQGQSDESDDAANDD